MTKIHIEIIGQGPPLILVHGWGWHSGIWLPLVTSLEQDFQLFLFDLPGFGKSPLLTSNYDFESLFEQIQPLIPSKVAWLGWSLGGVFAWWLAIHRPEYVSKLITVASSPKFVSSPDWPGTASSTLEKFSHSLSNNYQQTLEDFLLLQLRGSPHSNSLLTQLKEQLLTLPKTALPALIGGLKLLIETDLRSDLKKTICPSLHIFGQYDTLVPARVIPFILEQLPNAQCEIIQRSGHLPFLTQAEEFLKVLKPFISMT